MMLSCYAGPAGQIALAAARASKIPRAIRASFRNPEIGVARGFGKRTPSQMYKESKLFSNNNVHARMKNFLFGIFDNDLTNERIRRGNFGVKFKINDRELRISRGFGKRSITSSKHQSSVFKFFLLLLLHIFLLPL